MMTSWIKYITIFSIGCNPAIVTMELSPEADTGYDFVNWEECGQAVGDHPCNFALMDQNEDSWALYDYYDKTIVLDFSTMWCGVCNAIAQEGEEFINDYGADKLTWVTILIDDAEGNPVEQEDIEYWADTYQLNTPVLAGSRDMIDYSSTYGYNITSWPTIIIISPEMMITHGFRGWNESMVKQAVEENL